GDGDDVGFRRIEKSQEISEFLSKPRAAGPRPKLIVVPDSMASHLSVGGKRVWIDLVALANGDFDKLRLGSHSAAAPDGLVADVYTPLFQYFASSYDLVPFAYDWRLSIADNGGRLAAALRTELAKNPSEPVRIVAHGAGGLVVLMGLVSDHGLREPFTARTGARILLLDLPVQGSLRVARLLLGLGLLTQHLAALAMKAETQDITAAFREFPGLVDLLPTELLDSAVWSKLSGQNGLAPADAL